MRARDVARDIGADPEEVETVAALLDLGVQPDAMRRALDRGRLADAIFDAVLDPAREERTVSPAEIEARGGLPAEELALIVHSVGLSPPERDEPSFTEEEAQMFVTLAELRDIWTPNLNLQAARVFGRALARIAQTQVQLFRLQVEPRLRAQRRDTISALPDIHWAFERLLPLATPFLVAFHRRMVEHEFTEATVRAAEARTRQDALPGAVEVSLLFCDLKDFTAYADTEGDEAAVAAIERFGLVVSEERGEDGRVVKGLGDGFMLAFSEPRNAVAAGSGIVRRVRDGEGPGVHASVHRGVAVAREGDYFGGVVNLTARLLDAAGRDELVATAAVAEATTSEFSWEHAGATRVRGVAEEVDVYRLSGLYRRSSTGLSSSSTGR
jgi:class 3 adenylate cyclase